MALIEAYALTKRFGKITAVEDLSLSVERGEVLGFVGPNGAGKTTTIRMLAGIISPTSGYAKVAGHRTSDAVEKLHEVIGLLTESPGHYGRLSARRNLEYFAGFYSGINTHDQVEKYLRTVGLWQYKDRKAGTFSKGMKQRLALARALIHEPEVLFLDEPTAGLDPEAASEVRELLKKLSSEGRTIFLSTHNLTEAEHLCHRIAIIRTRLIALDTAEDLRRQLFRRQVVVQLQVVEPSVTEAVKRLPFVRNLQLNGSQLKVEVIEPDKNQPELVKSIVEAGGKVISVMEEKHTLEEVYLNLVQEGGNR